MILSSDFLSVEIQPDSNAGNLLVSRTDNPADVFDFRTCEGILSENSDFGLFKLLLALSDWKVSRNSLSYSWDYETGIRLRFKAELGSEELLLSYTIENNTGSSLKRVQIHPCIPTTGASSFFPEEREADACVSEFYDRRAPGMRSCDCSYFELYERIHLFNGTESLPLSETSGGKDEVHLAVMREGETPLEWAWWNNATETFSTPLIAVENKPKTHTVGLAFEQSIWASSNVGDTRACFHLFPYFGDIPAGESRAVSGVFFLISGTRDDALERFGGFAAG